MAPSRPIRSDRAPPAAAWFRQRSEKIRRYVIIANIVLLLVLLPVGIAMWTMFSEVGFVAALVLFGVPSATILELYRTRPLPAGNPTRQSAPAPAAAVDDEPEAAAGPWGPVAREDSEPPLELVPEPIGRDQAPERTEPAEPAGRKLEPVRAASPSPSADRNRKVAEQHRRRREQQLRRIMAKRGRA